MIAEGGTLEIDAPPSWRAFRARLAWCWRNKRLWKWRRNRQIYVVNKIEFGYAPPMKNATTLKLPEGPIQISGSLNGVCLDSAALKKLFVDPVHFGKSQIKYEKETCKGVVPPTPIKISDAPLVGLHSLFADGVPIVELPEKMSLPGGITMQQDYRREEIGRLPSRN